MKIVLLTGLLTIQTSVSAEVWWLEMEKTFHDALIKRFSEGDPAACRQIGDRLPALIKEGKIKELEWVTSDSKTGGRHFPSGEVERKVPDRESRLKTGSVLKKVTQLDDFQFEITTPGSGAGTTLLVQSLAPFANQWQPLFTYESGGRARILLGRDPSATQDFWKTKALFCISAPLPDSATLTWFLREGHPALAPPTVKPSRIVTYAMFEDSMDQYNRSSRGINQFGSKYTWYIDPKNGSGFRVDALREEKGISTVGKAYHATGTLNAPGTPTKIPVTMQVIKVDPNGTASDEIKKEIGEAVAMLVSLQ